MNVNEKMKEPKKKRIRDRYKTNKKYQESHDKRCRAWKKKNPEKYLSYYREYHRTHPWAKKLNSARKRCDNPKTVGYKYYGAKGIKCTLTIKEAEFLWFRDNAYSLERPSIDRIDSKKGYCLENCRFIELSENVRRATKGKRKKK